MKVPDDFDFTQRRVEQNEELDAVAWAENNGWLVRKMQYVRRVGAPDRIFFGYGAIVLIEMKKPGGRLSKGQKLEHQRIREHGCEVHVCFSKDEAITVLRRYMRRSLNL